MVDTVGSSNLKAASEALYHHGHARAGPNSFQSRVGRVDIQLWDWQACLPRLRPMIRLSGDLKEGFSHPLVNPERIQGGDGIREAILVVQGGLGPGRRVGLCQGLQTVSRSHSRAVAWSSLLGPRFPLGAKADTALPCSVTSGDETNSSLLQLSILRGPSATRTSLSCPPIVALASECPGHPTTPVGPGQARAWGVPAPPCSGQQMSLEAA